MIVPVIHCVCCGAHRYHAIYRTREGHFCQKCASPWPGFRALPRSLSVKLAAKGRHAG